MLVLFSRVTKHFGLVSFGDKKHQRDVFRLYYIDLTQIFLPQVHISACGSGMKLSAISLTRSANASRRRFIRLLTGRNITFQESTRLFMPSPSRGSAIISKCFFPGCCPVGCAIQPSRRKSHLLGSQSHALHMKGRHRNQLQLFTLAPQSRLSDKHALGCFSGRADTPFRRVIKKEDFCVWLRQDRCSTL